MVKKVGALILMIWMKTSTTLALTVKMRMRVERVKKIRKNRSAFDEKKFDIKTGFLLGIGLAKGVPGYIYEGFI